MFIPFQLSFPHIKLKVFFIEILSSYNQSNLLRLIVSVRSFNIKNCFIHFNKYCAQLSGVDAKKPLFTGNLDTLDGCIMTMPTIIASLW